MIPIVSIGCMAEGALSCFNARRSNSLLEKIWEQTRRSVNSKRTNASKQRLSHNTP